MKVRTNLSTHELEKAGSHLLKLAKSQRVDEVTPPENRADAGILKTLVDSFDTMLDSLHDSVKDILGETK